MRNNQSRPLQPLDDIRHGERLAGSGDPQQRLILVPRLKTRYQLLDGLGLITCGLELRMQFEFHVALPPGTRMRTGYFFVLPDGQKETDPGARHARQARKVFHQSMSRRWKFPTSCSVFQILMKALGSISWIRAKSRLTSSLDTTDRIMRRSFF